MLDTEQTSDCDTISWIDTLPKIKLCSFYQETPKYMPRRLMNVVPLAGLHIFRIPQTLNSRTPHLGREILMGGNVGLSCFVLTGLTKGGKITVL